MRATARAPPGNTPSPDIRRSFASCKSSQTPALLVLAGRRTEESPWSLSPHRHGQDHATQSPCAAPRRCGTGWGIGAGPPLTASPVGSSNGQMTRLKSGHCGLSSARAPSQSQLHPWGGLVRFLHPPSSFSAEKAPEKGNGTPGFGYGP